LKKLDYWYLWYYLYDMRMHDLAPLETLFPGKARRAVLAALFTEKHVEGMSMSELARRASLTPRAMAVEVRKLETSGFVSVEAVGTAYVVRPVASSPVVKALRAFLAATQAPLRSSDAGAKAVRASLTAFGALLPDAPDSRPLSLTETVLRGLALARDDATVFRTLPAVVAANAKAFDWVELKDRARHMKLKAELGMLLDLTADVSGDRTLHDHANELWDGRRKRLEYFPLVGNTYEEQLADRRTPAAAARWGFRMNMPIDVFRSALVKHAQVKR
jgi:AcrR family transcriptional regulator